MASAPIFGIGKHVLIGSTNAPLIPHKLRLGYLEHNITYARATASLFRMSDGCVMCQMGRIKPDLLLQYAHQSTREHSRAAPPASTPS